jgi:hypothetical protein
MKTISFVIVLVISDLLMNGCGKHAQNVESIRSGAPVDTALESRLREDEKNLAITIDNVNDLSARLAPLERRNAAIATEREEFGWAVTDFGRFPVRCTGVSPMLDGYKIHLLIGNMTTAILGGATVTVYPYPERPVKQSGESEKQFQDRLHKWYTLPSIRPVEVKVTTHLQPGKWTGVDAVIAPASPNDVKRITVGIEFATIGLSEQ